MAAAAATTGRRVTASSSTLTIVVLAAVVASSSFPVIRGASSSSSSSCSSHTFSGKVYASCADLPRLGATLHYNYTAATHTVSVAFRAPGTSKSGWAAWGLNPSSAGGMVGTQAVVAFRHSNGSVVAYPTVLDSYAPSMAPAATGDLAFPVSGVAAEEEGEENGMVVYATVALPAGKGSKFTHVWQQGSAVVDDVPAAHPTTGDNVLSTATIDFSE
ncbi:hypothetical protein U9M48_011962 [Paspalum notatum var. saurae]|uniref:DOMON domain-containing protein n=1 Tax=Paspalum notatum var. saurae TaxID=547442 RepID=A0AAQ3SWL1_PASNO